MRRDTIILEAPQYTKDTGTENDVLGDNRDGVVDLSNHGE
jgi:hypothetical protein